ncbi:thyrotropin-releasing hormone receptor-like [Saccostrea cucullata]|uniref:thyrotropin-releasing hormone receptor-like n=1 Tax=Saccostrea cuccullata TaxID=36930 RepID=UPI002ED67A73
MNGETEQNYNNSFWSSMLSSTDGTLRKSWNKSKSVYDKNISYNDFEVFSTVSFFLFNPSSIADTSEGFEKSIAILILIIGVLGFVGNIVTIFKIRCAKHLHTPTFLAIGCLALPDTLNIFCIFVRKFSDLYSYLLYQPAYNQSSIGFITYSFLDDTLISCSTAHIVFLAMIRYLLIVHPLESKIRLTIPIVMTCSLMIWIYSSLLTAFILIIISTIIEDSKDRTNTISDAFGFYRIFRMLLSVSAILFIHIKKLRALKMSSNSVTNSIRRKMNVIISIILSIYIFSLMPLMVLIPHLLHVRLTGSPFGRTFVSYTYNTSLLFGIFHYSCNPYILFLASHIISKRSQDPSK